MLQAHAGPRNPLKDPFKGALKGTLKEAPRIILVGGGGTFSALWGSFPETLNTNRAPKKHISKN